MGNMRIGDVCAILQIKSHILRYWERHLPFLKPQTNIAGHRIYAAEDLALLLRFKYLIYHKMYTIEGAAKILRAEEEQPSNHTSEFRVLRIHLLRLLSRLKYQEQMLNSIRNNTDDSTRVLEEQTI